MEKITKILNSVKFTFAKSMPKFPHEYTLRKDWDDDKMFCDVAHYIRNNGKKEYWGGKNYIYLYLYGYKYWTMGNIISYTDKRKTILINRVKI